MRKANGASLPETQEDSLEKGETTMSALARPISSGKRHPIPDKLYLKIGEVAEITGVKPYVLRYWESEFKMVNPSKSRSRQRLYRKADVELIFKIKELLYEERYTINGARKKLRELGYGKVSQPELQFENEDTLQILDEAIEELKELQEMLR
jgi:DNA-binding transcriptional MerR regulator